MKLQSKKTFFDLNISDFLMTEYVIPLNVINGIF
jgi:hypothetical protein